MRKLLLLLSISKTLLTALISVCLIVFLGSCAIKAKTPQSLTEPCPISPLQGPKYGDAVATLAKQRVIIERDCNPRFQEIRKLTR